MVDFVTDGLIEVSGAYKERYNLCLLVFYCVGRWCKHVCVSGPHNQRKCCLSESWTDLRSDSFRKECVWLGGNCRPTSCVNILSVPSNVSFPACQSISMSLPGSAFPTLPPGSSPPSPSLISAFSLPFIYILSLQPSLCAPSLPPFPPPLHSSSAWARAGRQAGRLPGWGPRWCSGESASSGSLSPQDGSTALLWPIWPRPVLAPVCDYGPAGGQQSWHSKPCQYTADWGTNCGEMDSHTEMWLLLQFCQWPLDGVQSMKQKTGCPGRCSDLLVPWKYTSGYTEQTQHLGSCFVTNLRLVCI